MNNTITSSIKNIIEDLEIEISEKQKCVDLLKTLDLSKPITEKVWQEVCNTSLRKNEAAMEVLAKSTFPEAKDIVVGGNYVKFMLHNFVCYILTDRWDGVINRSLDHTFVWYFPISIMQCSIHHIFF